MKGSDHRKALLCTACGLFFSSQRISLQTSLFPKAFRRKATVWKSQSCCFANKCTSNVEQWLLMLLHPSLALLIQLVFSWYSNQMDHIHVVDALALPLQDRNVPHSPWNQLEQCKEGNAIKVPPPPLETRSEGRSASLGKGFSSFSGTGGYPALALHPLSFVWGLWGLWVVDLGEQNRAELKETKHVVSDMAPRLPDLQTEPTLGHLKQQLTFST